MELKTRLREGLKTAMKEKDTVRLSTLRLINAAIKDREIAMRGEGEDDEAITDEVILGLLGKMVKQRQESARTYEEAGRLDMAEQEQAEIKVIESYLPKQLSDEEVEAAIAAAIEAVGAESLRDMGKVMGELKAQYTGRVDFGAVGPMVKAKLG